MKAKEALAIVSREKRALELNLIREINKHIETIRQDVDRFEDITGVFVNGVSVGFSKELVCNGDGKLILDGVYIDIDLVK